VLWAGLEKVIPDIRQRAEVRAQHFALALPNKCLCHLAGNSQVTWFVQEFLAGVCRNDMQTWITQALFVGF
jgi:hypothetical protein